jgi:hypothetical protein
MPCLPDAIILATACCGTHGISAVAYLQIPAGSGGRRRSCGRSSAVPKDGMPGRVAEQLTFLLREFRHDRLVIGLLDL